MNTALAEAFVIDPDQLQACFPTTGVYAKGPLNSQQQMLAFISKHGSALIESPTGSGKTAVAYAFLTWARNQSKGPCYYVVSNKALLAQVKAMFPEFQVALGRNEHPCLYGEKDKSLLTPAYVAGLAADPQSLRADDVPCAMLKACVHRVDRHTGETHEPGAYPCPYLKQRFEVQRSGFIVCTAAFFLYTRLFGGANNEEGAVVIDEVHQFARIIRDALSYEITDVHLQRAISLLTTLGCAQGSVLQEFLDKMMGMVKKRPIGEETLLTSKELDVLITILERVNATELLSQVNAAVAQGKINALEHMEALKQVDVVCRDLQRYIKSFQYSMAGVKEDGKSRKPLNYTCAFYRGEIEEGEKSRVVHKLIIKCFYVVPLIRYILPKLRLSFSATIGDPKILGYETGIKDPFLSLASDFSANNARLYMPTDMPDLSFNARFKKRPVVQGRRQASPKTEFNKVFRLVAQTALQFAKQGKRSLFVVVSNAEKEKFLELSAQEGLTTISYGNGVTARQAVERFKSGEGQMLVGTGAHFTQGIDLPKGIAPVIFYLRPAYPNPNDVLAQFEKERFGNAVWSLWNWRVMIDAMQVRGRNIRSAEDVGVTFYLSQTFRGMVYASLPEWLKPAYRGNFTWEQAVKDAMELLQK